MACCIAPWWLGTARANTDLVAYVPFFDGRNAEQPVVRELQVWGLDEPRLLKTVTIGGDITYVEVSSDGSSVYVADYSGSITVIETATLTRKEVFDLTESPRGMALSPDERSIYWIGRDHLHRLDLSTGESVLQATLSRLVGMRVSKDRRVLLLEGFDVDGFRYVVGWSAPENRVLFSIDSRSWGHVQAISSDLQTVFFHVGQYIRALDTFSGQIIWTRRISTPYELTPGLFGPALATEIRLSEDESQLLIATLNSGILRMDIASGEVATLHPELQIRAIDRRGNTLIALTFLNGNSCGIRLPLIPCHPYYEDSESVVMDLGTGQIISRIPFVKGGAGGRGRILGARPAIPIDTMSTPGSLLLIALIAALTLIAGRTLKADRDVGGFGR